MPTILLATASGCRIFTGADFPYQRPTERDTELPGRSLLALTPEPGGSCLAIVDGHQIWRRNPAGLWTHLATAEIPLQSLATVSGTIFAGAMDQAAILRIPPGGTPQQLTGFDETPGRETWFANGPPLGARSLAATAWAIPDGSSLLAAVHVGGIPRSTDFGATWNPTLPVAWDVHEVRAHPDRPGPVAAAAAAGLCLSHDLGRTWSLVSNGDPAPGCLSLAVLENEVLVSCQDGPFATRSQIWRFRPGDSSLTQVRDGLPEWLEGKVDTGWMAAHRNRAAIVDAGGNLWLSASGSTGWTCVSQAGEYPFALAIL